MTHCAVDLKGVQYRYPDGHIALDDIDFQVGLHERAVILGANGAGKSTLLSVMSGILEPTKGSIKILHTELTPKNVRSLRASMGLVFQEPDNQLFMPTLYEDVAFGPLNMGLPVDEVHERVKEALDIVGLSSLGDKPPHHLSVGEKKRAAIATVLAMQPKILILDEPTAHLDPKSRIEIIDFLAQLHQYGDLTLITATHDVDSVPLLADRAYILNQGQLIRAGTVAEAFSDTETLLKANLTPPIVTQLAQQVQKLTGIKTNQPLPMTLSEAVRVFSQQ
jgi:cobalt/nickel transport system ATP-binding protein